MILSCTGRRRRGRKNPPFGISKLLSVSGRELRRTPCQSIVHISSIPYPTASPCLFHCSWRRKQGGGGGGFSKISCKHVLFNYCVWTGGFPRTYGGFSSSYAGLRVRFLLKDRDAGGCDVSEFGFVFYSKIHDVSSREPPPRGPPRKPTLQVISHISIAYIILDGARDPVDGGSYSYV